MTIFFACGALDCESVCRPRSFVTLDSDNPMCSSATEEHPEASHSLTRIREIFFAD